MSEHNGPWMSCATPVAWQTCVSPPPPKTTRPTVKAIASYVLLGAWILLVAVVVGLTFGYACKAAFG